MGLFFFYVAQAWFDRIARDPFLAPVLLGVGGAVLGAMIGGLTDHYFFNLSFPHSVALFWLYVGLGMVAVRLGTAPSAHEEPGGTFDSAS
jgi:hypothetical protein